MTAQEFLTKYGMYINKVNFILLTRYTGNKVDYVQFPDAEIDIQNPDDFGGFVNRSWERVERFLMS